MNFFYYEKYWGLRAIIMYMPKKTLFTIIELCVVKRYPYISREIQIWSCWFLFSTFIRIDSYIKMTNVQLQMLNFVEIQLMIEKNLPAILKYAEANKKCMKHYSQNKDPSWQTKLD